MPINDEDNGKNEELNVLRQIHLNQVDLAKAINEIRAVTQQDRQQLIEYIEQRSIKGNHPDIIAYDAIEHEVKSSKKLIDHAYKQAQQYGKFLAVGFFGVYFGLYTIVANSIDLLWLHISAILVLLAASALAIFEVSNSILTNSAWYKSLLASKYIEGHSVFRVMEEEYEKSIKANWLRTRRFWLVTLAFTLTTGLSAIFILMNILISDIYQKLSPTVTPQTQEQNTKAAT
ncbi:MAG: hypothetical protein KUG56_07040 [Kordiimonadaceae bacterium]|nr:hypothetical protein [Kordiimonadaceae bacterium]